MVLCGSVIDPPGPSAQTKGTPDPALIAAFESIRQAFRGAQTSGLGPILSLNGKIFLSVKIIAAEAGFYSRDQLEALLKQAFAVTKTIKFDVNMDLDPARAEDRNVVVCPAAWIYLNKGVRSEINLRFLLARQQGRWMLGEIRETH